MRQLSSAPKGYPWGMGVPILPVFMEEKLGIKKEDMDFLFGRPALQTLSAYGYRLEGEEGQPTKIVKIKANESASA